MKSQKTPFDLYETITDKIVAMLDQGQIPWRKPWRASSEGPRNIEGHFYRGINTFMLLAEARSTPYFLTFKQLSERGGTVIKGEHGSMVVFFQMLEAKKPDEDGKTRKIPLLRYYRVFNLDQTENVKLPKNVSEPPELIEPEPIEAAETILRGMPNQPSISYGGDRAFYSPTTDKIRLPKKSSFETGAHYWATLFHEIGHSTGHESRLKRHSLAEWASFGSPPYAREELVAEFTSAFLCGESGITQPTVENTVAYCQSWMKALRDDNRAVVVAAGAAQKAADFILNRHFGEAEHETEAAA